MKNFFACLKELDALKLPIDKYAIAGSGPLAVRRIRDVSDLDVIVKEDIFISLSLKYSDKIKNSRGTFIEIGNLEIRAVWVDKTFNVEKMIDNSEFFGGYPYTKLKYVFKYKNILSRKKDLKDIQLLNEYLKFK